MSTPHCSPPPYTSVPLHLTMDSTRTWIKRTDKFKYTNMTDQQQFLEYCFSWLPEAEIQSISSGEDSNLTRPSNAPNIVVVGIRETEINVPAHSLGVLLCCEDCRRSDATPLQWGYLHYHKYGDTGNQNIKIYFYNHHPKIIETPKHIIVPFAYLYMSYFRRLHKSLLPSSIRPPQYRKFCIITTARHLPLQEWIKRLGPTDHISQFYDRIGSDSCYHSQKLIDLLSEYKFVLCGENAFHAGYITEKVFNALFARTIPIYTGPPDTLRYLNPKTTFIIPSRPTRKIQLQLTRRILSIAQNPTEYSRIISQYPLNPSFDDENYEQRLNQFIQPWLIETQEQRANAQRARLPPSLSAATGAASAVSTSTDTESNRDHQETLHTLPAQQSSTRPETPTSPSLSPPSTPNTPDPQNSHMSPPSTPEASYDLAQPPPVPVSIPAEPAAHLL